MKISCGTDMIEISRVRESINDMGDRFLNRIYTKQEIAYCEAKGVQKYQHYAARFAAKEAAFKAVSMLLKDKYDISWKDIEVQNDEQGRPKVLITMENVRQIEDIDISLSHCKDYAIANVVVLYK